MEDADKRPKSRRSRQKELDVLSDMSGRPQATDVLGSYTGTPSDGGQPVQDADDLKSKGRSPARGVRPLRVGRPQAACVNRRP